MQIKVRMTSISSNKLTHQLLVRFGPILGGRDLYFALGFKTYSAFHRSQTRGELGVHVFTLPRRRGWFALTSEVADWLTLLHAQTPDRRNQTTEEST